MTATGRTAATPTVTARVGIAAACAVVVAAVGESSVTAADVMLGLLLGGPVGWLVAPRVVGYARAERDRVTPREARALAALDVGGWPTRLALVVGWPMLTGLAAIAQTPDVRVAGVLAGLGLVAGLAQVAILAVVDRSGAVDVATAALRRLRVRRQLRQALGAWAVLLRLLALAAPEPWTPPQRRLRATPVTQHPVCHAPARAPIAAQAPPAAVAPASASPGVAAV